MRGRANPWAELYATGRLKPATSAGTFLKENIDFPTYLVGDRLKRPKGRSLSDVPRGGGQVLIVEGERIAVSRDDDGTARAVSAVCTHMGCIVRWNGAERSWDCPCHGSRFDAAYRRSLQTMKLTQVLMGQPEKVASVIARALGSSFPRARYLVGYDAQALALVQSLTPTAVKDRVIRLTLGL